MNNKKRFYILSIDGGGLKGLIAIKILEIIEGITGKAVTETFQLMGGTSTGGLIVSALTVEGKDGKPLYDLSYIENLYLEAGQTLFRQGGLAGKETQLLAELLHKTFGSRKIADTLVPVFVPTYDLASNRIVVFKTRSALLNEAKNIKLFDVCRATSAIPQVFSAHAVRYNNTLLNCVDGGYYMKNPAIAVLAEAWKHRSYYSTADLKETEIVLLSISTGNFSGTSKNWSADINEILQGQQKATAYIKEQGLIIDLPKINYLRVDLNLGSSGYSLQKLVEIGNTIEALSNDEAFRKRDHKLVEFLDTVV